ncbi:hypothetical protein B0H13DRAFT_2305718 [Mycena leptocephala]|nr:hypothetical protein B0H13DRAFT_2305718 [Mycena leptocephala]
MHYPVRARHYSSATKPRLAAACVFTTAACEAGVAKLKRSGIGTKTRARLAPDPGLTDRIKDDIFYCGSRPALSA